MLQDIPYINFSPNKSEVRGIEIITIESLKNRKSVLDHDPEKAHQLTFNILVYYTKGKSRHLVDFVWHEVQKNILIHVSKGQITAFQFSNELRGFIILFTDEYLKQQLNRLPKTVISRMFNSHLFSPKIQVPKDSNAIQYIKLFFNEFDKENNDYNKRSIYNSLFTIIFSKLERLKHYQTFHIKHTEKLEIFLKFRDLLNDNFTKSRNADFYASKLNITYKHLNTICKEIINTTAKSFIDEFIMLEAKRKLINSTIKSNELAFLMGFNEPTNFVKYFKKYTGLTPNSFKNKYK